MIHYPDIELYDSWKEKYKERVLLDRTNIIQDLNLDLYGSGKIVIKNGRISDVKIFDPLTVDLGTFIKETY